MAHCEYCDGTYFEMIEGLPTCTVCGLEQVTTTVEWCKDCKGTHFVNNNEGFIVCGNCGLVKGHYYDISHSITVEEHKHYEPFGRRGRYSKICDICTVEFIPNSNNQKRCSKICAKEHKRGYMRVYMQSVRKSKPRLRTPILQEG